MLRIRLRIRQIGSENKDTDIKQHSQINVEILNLPAHFVFAVGKISINNIYLSTYSILTSSQKSAEKNGSHFAVSAEALQQQMAVDNLERILRFLKCFVDGVYPPSSCTDFDPVITKHYDNCNIVNDCRMF